MYPEGGADNESLVISVSSKSIQNVPFKVVAELRQDFKLEVNKLMEAKVEPYLPGFFSFDFPNGTSTVLLQANGSTNVCMTLSIQNRTVYDLQFW